MIKPLQLNPNKYEIDLAFQLDEDREIAHVEGNIGNHPADVFLTQEEALRLSKWFGMVAKEIKKKMYS